MAEERRPFVERLLGEELRSAGFETTDPAGVQKITERVLEESGGFVDPATGARDAERYLAFRKRLGAVLHEELGCDGRLFAAIVTLRATFVSGVARWDGKTQQVSSTGRLVLNALAGVQEGGWVTAFSLWLRVLDLAGEEVAFRSAGVETPVQLAVVEDTDVLAEDHWLADEARLRGAIRVALGGGGHALRSEGKP